MSQQETDNSSTLKTVLYAIAGWGIFLTALTELSHYVPAIMELCGGDTSGCADVSSTPYAKMFGISVAWWGLLSYAVYMGLLRVAPIHTLPLAAALLGAELYFLWIMAVVIDLFCTFCIIQFMTVVILFIATLMYHRKETQFAMPGKLWSAPVVALVVFMALVIPVQMRSGEVAAPTGEFITYAGDVNSNIRVELFSDFLCGHCKNLEPEIDKLMEHHPDVLLVFRDYIIRPQSISPVAVSYANAIAYNKGREEFIKTRSAMFRNQANLYNYLKERLDKVTFTDELKKKIQDKVSADLERASSLNINSTPTMVIFKGEKMVQIIRSGTPYDKFKRFLQE